MVKKRYGKYQISRHAKDAQKRTLLGLHQSLALTGSSDALASLLAEIVRVSGLSPKKITSTVTSSLWRISTATLDIVRKKHTDIV